MGKADLIKTVRGLDKDGAGENGENLHYLWKCLSASADSQFHAAEESSLRWLLKSMNSTTPAAETLRRFPLAWTILGCVFQTIPLFSLAKSLADRRFIAVLQQTFRDISSPVTTISPQKPAKRKRSSTRSFALEDLKSTEGCIESGQAIFEALEILLRRLDTTASSSHDRIGAEHLRSLFCTPAAEVATIISPALVVCNILLSSRALDDAEGKENWVEIISTIWALHLQSNDDTLEVAKHIFFPSATILSRLEGLSQDLDVLIQKDLRKRWSGDLQKFMHRHFILPARASFLNRQDFEPVTKALEASIENLDVSAPALYFLAAGATEILVQRGVRKGNAEWMKRLFQAVNELIPERNDCAIIMHNILRQSRERSMPINTDDLRSVCQQYALKGDGTDWVLVANVVQCDPDVFQTAEAGQKLLQEVCDRALDANASEKDHSAISEVIEAIIRGFRTARDFFAFLKLWYEQLCEVERRNLQLHPWASIGREGSLTTFDYSLIESELSLRQLVDVIEWVESQDTFPQALCLWLNTVSQGVSSEGYKDSTGQKLLDLVLRIKDSSSPTTALKWRVVSRVLSWAPITERQENWKGITKSLSKILKKGPLQSAETYEAFKCCCQIWVSLNPDGEQINEASCLVEAFNGRLAAEVASLEVTGEKLPLYLSSEVCSEYRAKTGLQQYLAWYLCGSSRLNRLYFEKKTDFPQTLQNAIASNPKADHLGLEFVWKSLLENEHDMNHVKLAENLVERLVAGLRASRKEKTQTGERFKLWSRLISGLPIDAITRLQREKIMAILMKDRKGKKLLESASLECWKPLLSLATKLLARPTFYEGMQFQHLVDIADSLSKAFSDVPADNGTLLELVDRYSNMASATIRQMAENIEERSVTYFTETSDFISHCKDLEKMRPLHLTLLKALTKQLSQSSSCRNNATLASLPGTAQLVLGDCITSVIGEWVEDKKLLKKSNTASALKLLAAVDAAELGTEPILSKLKASSLKKLDQRSQEAMEAGDVRGWKLQTFLRRYMASELEVVRPTTFPRLEGLPSKLCESLLGEYVVSIVNGMETKVKLQYLKELVGEHLASSDKDGRLVAIQYIVEQFIESTASDNKSGDFDLSAAHSNLTKSLVTATTTTNAVSICRILYTLLEKKPHAITQWNVETLLGSVAVLASTGTSTAPFIWLCKLVEIIIKKHRLRLESHYHVLLNTMQPLLCNLITQQREPDDVPRESKAHAYSRLVTLICEPTAGAVSRSQHHSALDSATDAAKRSAGRHMYLVLMQYVKIQLETDVPRNVREALEPAMNSIFNITPPEGRKILNDAMDGSGRAILREMFKRYTKFGKWSGV